MMIEDCILETYPTVHPHESIKSIEPRLKEKNYLVVKDEKNKFYGILTPSDILTKPYQTVIDCLTFKGRIQTDDSLRDLIGKFEKTPSEALPVFRQGEYIGILEKNHAIKKLKCRLDDFRKESLIAQKVKTSFLQNVSHEIRTPLNHILGFMSLVSDLTSEKFDPNKDEFYEIIMKSSEQFLSVMHDLIELSRIYAGEEIRVHCENTIIEQILADVKGIFESQATVLYDGRLHVNYRNQDKSLMIFTDGKKLKLIIQRLINYIIKQIQKDDCIEFGCKLVSDRQEICFYVEKTNDCPINASESGSPGTITQSLNPEYSFQNQSDFSMELAQRMIRSLGGSLVFDEYKPGARSVHFTIPYHPPQIN